ncbi:MAG: hypothetical protein NT007_07155 [Candidatus Kapabacteria bacterium]|nr:hypothetical protein [Candidatus Kapabacteria bacterium]
MLKQLKNILKFKKPINKSGSLLYFMNTFIRFQNCCGIECSTCNILIIFLSLSGYILLNSCASPTDINASRKKTLLDPGSGTGSQIYFNLDHDTLDFGQVSLTSYKKHLFTIKNISDEVLIIDSIHYADNRNFQVLEKMPIVINAAGSFESSLQLSASFAPVDTVGIYYSQIQFGRFKTPILYLKGTVPCIEVPDLDCGPTKIGHPIIRKISLINNSRNAISVLGFKLIDPDSVFLISPDQLPKMIYPNINGSIEVHFQPNKAKIFNATIEFFLDSSTCNINPTCSLRGRND